jgi:hypothetical protein
MPIIKLIVSLEDVDSRWELAINYTEVVSSIISNADDYAGKLVNGSCGDFCENTASLIVSMWEQLVGLPSNGSEHLIKKVLTEDFISCLGDYGDLSAVLSHLNN